MIGVCFILFSLTDGWQANIDAYRWPMWLNDLYQAFNKWAFILPIMFMMFTMFLGHFDIGMHAMKNTYCRAFGKMTFLAALASPIVITLLYLGQDYALYMTNPQATTFAMGHIFCNLWIAFLLYIFIEYPIATLLGHVVTYKLRHTDLLKIWYE